MGRGERRRSESREAYAIWNSLSPLDQFRLLNFVAQNGRKWKYKLIKLWNGPRTNECLRVLGLKRLIGEKNLYEMFIPATGGVQKGYFAIVGDAAHHECRIRDRTHGSYAVDAENRKHPVQED